MELSNIKIVTVGKKQEGTSSTTGKHWTSRNLLLSFEDEFGESYINAVVDENVWQQLGFEEGQIVTLNLRFRTKRFLSGFIANDIRVFIPQNA